MWRGWTFAEAAKVGRLLWYSGYVGVKVIHRPDAPSVYGVFAYHQKQGGRAFWLPLDVLGVLPPYLGRPASTGVN